MEASRFARAGDRIIVCKLDRLGRSIQGLISLAADLSARKLLAAGDKPAKVTKLLQIDLSTFHCHFPAGERTDEADAA